VPCRRDGPVRKLLVAVSLLGLACATSAEPELDVAALAAAHGLARQDLRLYLVGYQEGYDEGHTRMAGMRAGVGVGGGSGLEGRGWQLGFQDAMNGRPQQDPDVLAQRLAEKPSPDD
jgi:hypothetical protein